LSKVSSTGILVNGIERQVPFIFLISTRMDKLFFFERHGVLWGFNELFRIIFYVNYLLKYVDSVLYYKSTDTIYLHIEFRVT
jgi:hypothetical protein